mgnify:CR=1 FL=1
MINGNGDTIVFCNESCNDSERVKCPAAYGLNKDHVEMYEDWIETYDPHIVASVQCSQERGEEYFSLYTEAKYEL